MGSFHTPARVRASGTSVASRWMQVWLLAAGERCVSSRATTSTGTPRRISPDDHPYRARWRVSSLLHAADRAGADQGSDRRNAAVSVPVAWRPSPVRAAASYTCSWTTRPGPWPPRSVVICLVCEPVRGPWPPVWFLAGPVGHLSADRWQLASYRVPAVPRGTDAARRSAARSPRLTADTPRSL